MTERDPHTALALEFEAHRRIELDAWQEVASCPTPPAMAKAREASGQVREIVEQILALPAAGLSGLKAKALCICWALADDAPQLLRPGKRPLPTHWRAAQAIVDDLLRL
jgi:hypothetical protein